MYRHEWLPPCLQEGTIVLFIKGPYAPHTLHSIRIQNGSHGNQISFLSQPYLAPDYCVTIPSLTLSLTFHHITVCSLLLPSLNVYIQSQSSVPQTTARTINPSPNFHQFSASPSPSQQPQFKIIFATIYLWSPTTTTANLVLNFSHHH